ncbi:flavin monoamine oxidase family protein [Neisseria animalis]|uniref:FAD-binding protein n=1 Tax=Neisseria animalis TaxID=492 RepID=A0A5P3MR81_NEIAN|nr:FAD-dependent oxidoreductase [Neisseria animalis]QEY24038.1 FAD-binding protein [Neisseria animalis]ROW32606.1 FAD-binding protein [Neisseria animalis]VEE06134.1 Putrescine oxidase [Neisseria animalis]
MRTQTLIIGGGLAGLYAAYLLEQQGKDYLLLEAQNRFGGRIDGFEAENFELGATWFWGGFQPQLQALVDELKLPVFEQYEQGDLVYEHSPSQAPIRTHGYHNSPASLRIAGGMSALVNALLAKLPPRKLCTDRQVQSITQQSEGISDGILVQAANAEGAVFDYEADHVLLALPPRLAANLAFSPSLPSDLQTAWADTPTWMAPHAKYVAVYERPFWREQGLSGEGRSRQGILGEIHDISMPNGKAALFGFFNVPAQVRRQVSDDDLQAHCRALLVRLFGEQAASPVAQVIKDWANSPFTTTEQDIKDGGQHPMPAPSQTQQSVWADKIIGISSEYSPQFCGYLAGAVDAAARGVKRLGG